jgi:hypothetical protein
MEASAMDSPWRTRGRADADLAKLITALLARREEVLSVDPWLPFPQNCCCFGFGEGQRPLPVGALVWLWDRWRAATGLCAECGGRIYATGFGGLLSIGGVVGHCSGCGRRYFRPVGGLSTVGAEAGRALERTEFTITLALFGGVVEGPRRPLWQALRALGVRDLPAEEWAGGFDPTCVSLRLDTVRGRKQNRRRS